MKEKIEHICDIIKRSVTAKIILVVLFLLSMWVILSLQFHLIPVISTSLSDDTVNALNIFLLTLSYSYLAALISYLVSSVLGSKHRKPNLDGVFKHKVHEIGRGIRDMLLEFSRETNFGPDIHNISNTDEILRSKDWLAIIPIFQQYHKRTITYLQYMQSCGVNMKAQISDFITKYHDDMTTGQLVELENLSNAQFFMLIDSISSFPGIQIADSGYTSLINAFIALQNQFMKVEKEFGIETS